MAAAPSLDWEEVLVDDLAYVGEKPNATTATALTTNQEVIEATFWPAHPPLRSRVFLHSPDLDPDNSRILRMVDGLLLLLVAVRRNFHREYDHFIYRLDPPLLRRLPRPHSFCFDDNEVGLLPRGDHYTVAALVTTRTPPTLFTLHLFHSEAWSWRSMEVSLETPQEEYPMEIPRHAYRLLHHETSTVITIGGEGGTMGWVDLWRGILLCDVLRPNPALRGVPLPLPMAQLNRGGLGYPEPYRATAFIKSKRCLSFVDLDVRGISLPHLDPETGVTTFRIESWAITTWSNCKMTNSLNDWRMDSRPVQAKNMTISKKMRSQLLRSQLLQPAPGRTLQNLSVSFPILSMDGKNVVYLLTRAKFMHPKAWLLALDMKNRKLQDLAEFDAEGEPGAYSFCFLGTVSKYTMQLLK